MKLFHFDNGIEVKMPDNWKVEEEGNVVSLYDPENGVGALQFSIYKANSSSINVSDELEDYIDDKHEHLDIKQISNYAYCDIIDEDDVYWRYWLFLKMDDVVFVSYNCDETDKNHEYDLINDIIESVI